MALLLLLLLAAAPAGASSLADFATSSDDEDEEQGAADGETITFNGAKHPKYVDPNQYGPVLPGQKWKESPANAFNALQSMPPMEKITVTAPDGKTYTHDVEFKRDAKGKIVGGTIAFDTGDSCLAPVPISGLAGKQPLQPWEKAYLDHVAKNAGDYAMPDLIKAAGVSKEKTAAENKGFCPSGDCGSAPKDDGIKALADDGESRSPDDSGSSSAPDNNEAFKTGRDLGLFASNDTGGGSTAGGGMGGRTEVIAKGEVWSDDESRQRGLIRLWTDTANSPSLKMLKRAGGTSAGLFGPAPEAAGETGRPDDCRAGDGTRGLCVK